MLATLESSDIYNTSTDSSCLVTTFITPSHSSTKRLIGTCGYCAVIVSFYIFLAPRRSRASCCTFHAAIMCVYHVRCRVTRILYCVCATIDRANTSIDVECMGK